MKFCRVDDALHKEIIEVGLGGGYRIFADKNRQLKNKAFKCKKRTPASPLQGRICLAPLPPLFIPSVPFVSQRLLLKKLNWSDECLEFQLCMVIKVTFFIYILISFFYF